MIRINVEMWPGGDEVKKYPLAAFEIVNLGTSADPRRGNYGTRAYGKHGRQLRRCPGIVLDWPRLSRPVLSLPRAALESAGY